MGGTVFPSLLLGGSYISYVSFVFSSFSSFFHIFKSETDEKQWIWRKGTCGPEEASYKGGGRGVKGTPRRPLLFFSKRKKLIFLF